MKLDIEGYQEMEDAYEGVCLNCGRVGHSSNGRLEPDAEHYPCPVCGEDAMVGAMTALIDGLFS